MDVNDARNERIERYQKEIRGGLIALGAPLAAIGAWALFGPHSWYSDFPGGGHHWVSALGPYDEHLVRDFGGLYLGVGLLVVWAAVLLERRLVQAALGTFLVFSIPHLIYHLTKLDALSTGDNVADISTLAITVALPLVLLALSRRPRTQAAPQTKPTIEEGVTYGTR
jgi:hypothetical protein